MEKKYSSWLSFKTFYMKETTRFLKVWGQTVLGPVITTVLYLLIFVISLKGTSSGETSYTYGEFLLPGVIMMAIIQNTYANTSSSILIAKLNGNVVDLLMAPVTSNAIILAYVTGAITRSILIGAIMMLVSLFFMKVHFYNIGWMIYFGVSASMILSLVGLMTGIMCKKFEQTANVANLVIVPFSFLSGTFYSIKKLPEVFQYITHYNPFFYMIDGFRYSFIGVSDSNVYVGAVVLLAINIVLYSLTYLVWHKGYRIKE